MDHKTGRHGYPPLTKSKHFVKLKFNDPYNNFMFRDFNEITFV